MRELICWDREKDPQEEGLQQTVKDDEGATQRHFLLQAFLEFDPFAKLSVAVHNPYLSSSSWHWRAAGLDHDVQKFNEELASWEKDQEEEVRHAGQDYEEAIQRYDAMVRREWVPLLQACLVLGSICMADTPGGWHSLLLSVLPWYSLMQFSLTDTPGGDNAAIRRKSQRFAYMLSMLLGLLEADQSYLGFWRAAV
eukprot:1884579-Amphidinium_carterae.1